MIFSQIRASDVGKSIVCIFCGILFRFLAVLLASHSKKYNFKERLFMAFSYMPKSTAVATVAGVIYNESLSLGQDYEDY